MNIKSAAVALFTIALLVGGLFFLLSQTTNPKSNRHQVEGLKLPAENVTK